MKGDERAPVDAETIRETYTGILHDPRLPEATELDKALLAKTADDITAA